MASRIEEEIWKPIRGYEGKYEISNLGRVKALERSDLLYNGHKRVFKEKILKNEYVMKNGYTHIKLWKDGVAKSYRRSRVVLKTFKSRPDEDSMIADHIDGDRRNDNLSNLRWVTTRGNVANHGYARYLQNVLKDNGIDYLEPESWLSE